MNEMINFIDIEDLENIKIDTWAINGKGKQLVTRTYPFRNNSTVYVVKDITNNKEYSFGHISRAVDFYNNEL